MDNYETAQICLNGHMIARGIETGPEFTSKFCSDCGEKTITSCPACEHGIRGRYSARGILSLRDTPVRAYCHNCGQPYPWTQTRLETAREMADELDGLSADERENLKATLPDLISTTPKTELAATRFKKLLTKAGGEMAPAMKRVVVDLASELAKKLLLGE